MAKLKPFAPPKRSTSSSSSSFSDTSSHKETIASSGDEQEQQQVKRPAGQGGDGDDDEESEAATEKVDDESEPDDHLSEPAEEQALFKWSVLPFYPTKPSTSKRTATAAGIAAPSSSKKKKMKGPGADPTKSPPLEKAKEVPRPPRKAAAALKEVAELPSPKKAAAGKKAVASDAAGKAAMVPLPDEDAEKHFQEKRETYCYLAQQVEALEKELNTPGMYRAAFLNVPDAKATRLNAKIKNQKLAEIEMFNKKRDIEKKVNRTMLKFMD